jgi:hypothetical protein
MKTSDNDNESNNNDNDTTTTRNQQLRKSLQQATKHRVASLTPAEAFFLHRLLVDADELVPNKHLENACKRLDDDILFSTMPPATAIAASPSSAGGLEPYVPPLIPLGRPSLPAKHRKANRHSTVGLWKAHHDGVTPNILRSKSAGAAAPASISSSDSNKKEKIFLAGPADYVSPPLVVVSNISSPQARAAATSATSAATTAEPAAGSGICCAVAAVGNNERFPDDDEDDDQSIASDVEVRHHHPIGTNTKDNIKNKIDDDDDDSASSWDEAEHAENFDA